MPHKACCSVEPSGRTIRSFTSEVFLGLHPVEVGDPHVKEFATCQNSASVNPVALRKYGTQGPANCAFDIVPGSIHINQRALVGELVS